jgi:hypothetical protein
MVSRSATLFCVGVVAWCAAALAAEAQSTESDQAVHVETGVGASYFLSYVTEDAQTRYWGLSLSAQFWKQPTKRIELGYTYVPQRTTSSSAAPVLHAVRAMVLRSTAPEAGPFLRLAGGLGAAVLIVDAQTIDCGDFPLCSEWAPGDGTRFAPAATGSVTVSPSRRVQLFGELRGYYALGDAWSAAGSPRLLTETGIGLRVIF